MAKHGKRFDGRSAPLGENIQKKKKEIGQNLEKGSLGHLCLWGTKGASAPREDILMSDERRPLFE